MVWTVVVQLPHVMLERPLCTVVVELPAFARVFLTIDSVHVTSVDPPDSTTALPSRLAVPSVPTAYGSEHFSVFRLFLQITVAEAVPTPTTAIIAMAAIMARPNILRC